VLLDPAKAGEPCLRVSGAARACGLVQVSGVCRSVRHVRRPAPERTNTATRDPQARTAPASGTRTAAVGGTRPLSNLTTMDERSRRIAKRFEVPLLIAALLVIPVIVIEESNVSDTWKTVGAIVNWGIWVTFALEVVVMLAVVPSRGRWLRDNPLEVAIVLFTPPFLPASLQALRVFRLLRLARLVRLAPLARRLFSLEGLRYVALLALLTVLGGGAGFAAVEKDSSTWDGVWWAVTTITTVGYGDIAPKTVPGRVIGMAVMLVGIGFIAVLTGAVAQRFLASQIEEVEEAMEEVEATDAEVLAELREVRSRLERLESRLSRS